MENLYLHSPLKSRFLDLGRGDGGLLFHFILSKIVHSSEAEVMQSFLSDESVCLSSPLFLDDFCSHGIKR